MKKSLRQSIIKSRVKLIHAYLFKRVPARFLAHEVAMLVLDVLEALRDKMLTPKEASRYFVNIAYKIDSKTDKKLSDGFQQVLAEAMLLDELNKKYGPSLKELRRLALVILDR